MTTYNHSETDSCSESDYEYESDNDELFCSNIDPSLAKLMGIIVEETKTDWQPPKHAGLSNSAPIIKNDANHLFFVIKDKIKNRVKLNEDEFTYIKNSSHEEKLEIIKIYNFMM